MMILETFEFAPNWIKELAKGHGFEQFSAYSVIRLYPDTDFKKHPSLRDRSEDVIRALSGFGEPGSKIFEISMTGGDLYYYGFQAVGAQFVQLYKIFFKK